jgi:hypothetical protein
VSAWALPAGAVADGAVKTATATATALCADGDCTNEVNAARDVSQRGLDALSHAGKYGIRPYNELREVIRGLRLEAHHIIERRFAETLDLVAQRMPSFAMTPEEHQIFTNLWRQAIPYASSQGPLTTATATANDIWTAAQIIYAGFPEVIEAVGQILFGS